MKKSKHHKIFAMLLIGILIFSLTACSVEESTQVSMGSEETLSSFLAFAKEKYPAKKTGFVFWNHSDGSVTGAEFDENYDGDSLTLDEMYSAFGKNYEL